MAPGSFRDFTVIAVSALSFVGFLTLVGFLYEKYNEDNSNSNNGERKSRYSRQQDNKLRTEQDEELTTTAENLQAELTDPQVVFLLELLDKADDVMLESLLVTLSNCCAFTTNQNLIREKGGLEKLILLVDHKNSNVRSRAVQTLSNLAMNIENQKYIKVCIPTLLTMISPSKLCTTSEDEAVAILQLLINMSVVNTWHGTMTDSISHSLEILESPSLSLKVKTNALRLLVNLSCNADNAEFYIKNKNLSALENFLKYSPSNEENVLRAVTVISNILSMNTMEIHVARAIPNGIKVKLNALESSENEEIAEQVRKIERVLDST